MTINTPIQVVSVQFIYRANEMASKKYFAIGLIYRISSTQPLSFLLGSRFSNPKERVAATLNQKQSIIT